MLRARLMYLGVVVTLLGVHPFFKFLAKVIPSGMADGHL